MRNSDKGGQVASQFPKVRLVYADLDNVDVLEEEARKADIVLSEQIFGSLTIKLFYPSKMEITRY